MTEDYKKLVSTWSQTVGQVMVSPMKKFLAALVMSLFLTNFAYSYTAKGVVSCGTIISKEKEAPLITKGMMTAYLNGYITGRNYETNESVGKGVDNDSIFYAILKYCRDNPLKKNLDAAEYIYKKLK